MEGIAKGRPRPGGLPSTVLRSWVDSRPSSLETCKELFMVGFMTVYHREDCPMPRLMFFNSWTSLCIGCQLGALTSSFVSTYLAFRHQTFRGPLDVLLLPHAQPIDQQLHHIMRVDDCLIGA